MKPNAIVLTDQGIGCIQAPIKGTLTIPYFEALESAMKEVVLFRDQKSTNLILTGYGIHPKEQGKLYPIPEGYEIKIIQDFDSRDSFYPCIYAILVPKQEPEHSMDFEKIFPPMPKQNPVKEFDIPTQKEFEDACLNKSPIPKQPTSIKDGISDEQVKEEARLSGIKIDKQSYWELLQEGCYPEPDYAKQPASIEEAAKKYSGLKDARNDYDEQYYNGLSCDRYDAFITGAKSDAAQEYWFEKFKKEKK